MTELTPLEKRFGRGCLDRNPLLGQHITCVFCGKDEELHWDEVTNKECKEQQYCFYCNFWSRLDPTKRKTPIRRHIVVQSVHYTTAADTNEPSRWKGHGGRLFKIKRADGTIEECSNLWCQGNIPPIWREKFPDNAEFV